MKKFLALVMALAMVMSLTVVSTSAKDFTDDDSITYTEAIDVISALEIMDGYTDGSFQPNTQLNRGQAAKIICNLILGVAAADNLTATRAPFPDVPASHIFAGYISYCAQEGIISGYSDGYFRPGDTLSGYAFMKMLLGALGYDQTNEGLTGNNWTIQCAKLVQGIGLARDLEDDFLGSKTVTREEAALYALNTLQARTVEYVVPGGSFTVNGVEINQKASNATYRTYDTLLGGTTGDPGRIGTDGYIEFAEEHFTRLVLDGGGMDDFGRPQHTWIYKGDKIGDYADTPDATYEGYVTLADLYADLALTSTTKYFKVFIDGTIPSYFYTLGSDDYEDAGPDYGSLMDDGLLVSGTTYDILEIDSNSIADIERVGVGPGCTIEAFKSGVAYDKKTAEDKVRTAGTIVVINTYVGEVTSVNDAEGKRSANIEISPVGDFYEEATTIFGATDAPLSGGDYGDTYNTDKFEVGDIVTFNYKYNNAGTKGSVKKVAVAETVEGEVKEYTDQESFVLDSTEYKYSKMAPQKVKSEDVGTNIVAYLDKQGNVLYFDEGADNNKNFALVLDAGTRSAVGGRSFEAELLFTDGTTKLVSTDKRYGNTGNTDTNSHDGGDDSCLIGSWVTFREKSNGQYVLTEVRSNDKRTFTNMMTADAADGHVPEKVENGSFDFVIGNANTVNAAASNVWLDAQGDGVDNNDEVVRVNSSTLIIVQTKDGTFKVYNGVKELPQITQADGYVWDGSSLDGKTDENTDAGRILYSALTRENQSYAKFLYIDASQTAANGDKMIDVRNRANNDIFLVGNGSQGSSKDSNGNLYYAFKGVVDGTPVERIRLSWDDPRTRIVINMLLGEDVPAYVPNPDHDRSDSAIALSNYSIEDGLYEVDYDDEIDQNDKGVIVNASVDKVTADVIQIDGVKGDGDTYDLAEGCQFFRVDGNNTNLRIRESTWKGIGTGDINDKYAYVALSLNRDYEVTAVYWRLVP